MSTLQSKKNQSIDIFPLQMFSPRILRSLKSRLKDGESLYGIFLQTFSPTIAEILGLCGYDFVVVDMEHGHGGISDALPCIRAVTSTNTATILRLPESSPTWAKKALDIGPQGIMFPMIECADSARQAVSYCRFPPHGIRGAGYRSVRASGYGTNSNYVRDCDEELLILCQVESREGVRNIESIAAVDGVDCIQMGPTDLSASLGCISDSENAVVIEALRGAEKAVVEVGKTYLSGFLKPGDGVEEMRRRGYHMAACSTDVALFRTAALKEVERFKLKIIKTPNSSY